MEWTRWRDRLIKKERLTTFNSELSRGAVVAMFVGSGAAVRALVRHTDALDDQGQKATALRASHPLGVHQALAVMLPYHPGEGLAVE